MDNILMYKMQMNVKHINVQHMQNMHNMQMFYKIGFLPAKLYTWHPIYRHKNPTSRKIHQTGESLKTLTCS